MSHDPVRSTAPATVEPVVTVPDPIPTPHPTPWSGRSVMVYHLADGSVAASSRGLIAVGLTEGAALVALAREVKKVGRAAASGDTPPSSPGRACTPGPQGR